MELLVTYKYRLVVRSGEVQYTASSRRDLALLGYLGHVTDQTTSLRGVTPWQVKWSTMAVHVIHDVVPRSQVLYVLNGSVVALCRASRDQV